MKLTSEELITWLEKHELNAGELENKLCDEYFVDSEELYQYTQSSFITLLGLMMFNNLTVEEMLEKCLDNLHK